MAKTDERRPRAKKVAKENVNDESTLKVADVSAPVNAEPAAESQLSAAISDAVEQEILELPVLPLRGTVVFPLTVVPLAAAQARSLRLIDEAMSGDRTVALVMQKDPEQEGAGPNDVYEIGTIATIHQMMRVPDGSVRLAVQGIERMRILDFISEEPFLVARVEKAPEELTDSVEVQA